MSNTTLRKETAHVLVYPTFGAGHFYATLELTRQLLTRGIVVTLVVTANDLSSPKVEQLLSDYPPSSFQPLVLPTYEFTDMGPTRNFIFANVRGQRELHYPALLNWFKSQPSPPPVAIISDCLLGWTNHLANEIGVPRLLFSPCGACPVAVINSLWRDLPKRDNPDDVEFPITISRVPNSQTYPWWQIPDPYEDYKEGDPDSEFFRSSELGNVESWGVGEL
ncbi:UDP-glucuronosyl/UDP-glucosyltransferase [Parasponia andersonii]|uniref:UDP-glucuronosyl/UDP-glucosyltransferase n=1 Tax=Parasponia andersonii TaxID=3476 RepID=A0A2P5BFZ0_PARAD|nr:UDP-glucuronosyl/UDP-glucosyltransferase [Parasponia andersonii]